VKQQVLGRVTANTEFGKNHDVRLQLVTSAVRVGNYFCGVADDIADGEVDLGER
jgi:hypothetical protein